MRVSIFALAVPLALAGCTVPTVDLSNKACDSTHPCVTGFVCVDQRCVTTAPDAGGTPGADAGGGACAPQGMRTCGSNEGECVMGAQFCSAGTWGACQGEVAPTEEICDGKDNDCNGKTDEPEGIKGPLCPLQQGVCAGSRQRCDSGGPMACGPAEYGALFDAAREVRCDGLDNDCDGQTDEGLDNDRDGYGVDVACGQGTNDCDDWDPAVHPGAASICNASVDDDCDGVPDTTRACALGQTLGTCDSGCNATGQRLCDATCGAYQCVKPTEVCNGVDDDCDGETDEGLYGGFWTLPPTEFGAAALAGLPGTGFAIGWAGKASGTGPVESQVFSLPLGSKTAAVTSDEAAEAALAMTDHHVFFVRKGDGVYAQVLVNGRPQGRPFLVTAGGLRVRAQTDGKGSHAVVAFPAGLVSASVVGTSASTIQFPVAVTDFAVAKRGSAPLVVYEDFTSSVSLRAVDVSKSGNAPYTLVPSSLNPRQPDAAGEAFAFVDADNPHSIYVARTAATALAVGSEMRVLHPGTSGQTVGSPAIARLGADTYLVAWAQSIGSQHVINTNRIAYTAAGWGAPEEPTGWSSDLILDVATASDGQSFGILISSEGGAGVRKLVFRTSCPN